MKISLSVKINIIINHKTIVLMEITHLNMTIVMSKEDMTIRMSKEEKIMPMPAMETLRKIALEETMEGNMLTINKIISINNMIKETIKETNMATNKETNTKTNMATNKETNMETNKETNTETTNKTTINMEEDKEIMIKGKTEIRESILSKIKSITRTIMDLSRAINHIPKANLDLNKPTDILIYVVIFVFSVKKYSYMILRWEGGCNELSE